LHLTRGIASIFAEIFSAQFPVHTPTAAARAVFAKEQLKVAPEFLRERMKRKVKRVD
jgi:hypothetical protein